MGAVAVAAGADPARALGLGVSMTALQASIGALNDIHDAPDDAGHKPGKPIPAGLVSVPAAWAVVVTGAALGIGLGTLADVRVGVLAVVVLLIGYGYDLVAKGTAWSWLPFALGIPLLPVYGWLGATGDLPAFFIALVPMAMLAGAALAIANARADLERDVAAGTVSVGDPARPRGVVAAPRRPLVLVPHRGARLPGVPWRGTRPDPPGRRRGWPHRGGRGLVARRPTGRAGARLAVRGGRRRRWPCWRGWQPSFAERPRPARRPSKRGRDHRPP